MAQGHITTNTLRFARKMRRAALLSGLGLGLLAGVLSVSGDPAPAAGINTSAGNGGASFDTSAAGVVSRTFARTSRTFGQTFRQHFNMRDIAVNAANGASFGDSLADFRRDAQLRLLQTIDGELSNYGETTLQRRFPAVRKTGVDFSSAAGGRKGNLGINLIGAFAEHSDFAAGWQLRVYAGQEDSTGLNGGIFYRRIVGGGMLVGGNVFADYEKHDYGEFVRYSVGGELQNKHFSFFANLYEPVSDARRVSDGIVAFSRGGYDAKLRINAPSLRQLRAAVDYYHFDGEHGRAADKGFRFGGEWYPTPALRMNLFYDDGAAGLGGEVAYTHTLGEEAQGWTNGGAAAFAPDWFAPVVREYSQRIALATMAATMTMAPPGPPPFTYPAGAILLTSDGFYRTVAIIDDTRPDLESGVSYTFSLTTEARFLTINRSIFGLSTVDGTATLRFRAAPSYGSVLFTATVIAFETGDAATSTVSMAFTVGAVPLTLRNRIAFLTLSRVDQFEITPLTTGYAGLLAQDSNYAFDIFQDPPFPNHHMDVNFSQRLEFFMRGMPTVLLTATLVASDANDPFSPTVSIFYNITAVRTLAASFDYVSRVYVADGDGASFTAGIINVQSFVPPISIALSQGEGTEVTFSLSGTSLMVTASPEAAIPATFPPQEGRGTSATLTVSDASPLTPPLVFPVSVFASGPLSASLTISGSPLLTAEADGTGKIRNDYGLEMHAVGGLFGPQQRSSYFFFQYLRTEGNIRALGQQSGNVYRIGTIRADGTNTGPRIVRIRVDDDNNITGDQTGDLTPPVDIRFTITVVADPNP